jgi:hypothetical protein
MSTDADRFLPRLASSTIASQSQFNVMPPAYPLGGFFVPTPLHSSPSDRHSDRSTGNPKPSKNRSSLSGVPGGLSFEQSDINVTTQPHLACLPCLPGLVWGGLCDRRCLGFPLGRKS